MSTVSLLLSPEGRRAANRLLEVLQRERVAEWARMSRTPVVTIAQTLSRGICEGNPQTGVRQRVLVRWLLQLRDSAPGPGHLRPAGG